MDFLIVYATLQLTSYVRHALHSNNNNIGGSSFKLTNKRKVVSSHQIALTTLIQGDSGNGEQERRELY